MSEPSLEPVALHIKQHQTLPEGISSGRIRVALVYASEPLVAVWANDLTLIDREMRRGLIAVERETTLVRGEARRAIRPARIKRGSHAVLVREGSFETLIEAIGPAWNLVAIQGPQLIGAITDALAEYRTAVRWLLRRRAADGKVAEEIQLALPAASSQTEQVTELLNAAHAHGPLNEIRIEIGQGGIELVVSYRDPGQGNSASATGRRARSVEVPR